MSEPNVFLCFGSATECQNCGGHTRAIHPDEGRGPFPGDSRFCSEECFVEFQEITERIAAMPSRVTACSSCGLDNFEHEADCPLGNGSRKRLASPVKNGSKSDQP